MKRLLLILLCVPLIFSCGENEKDTKIKKLEKQIEDCNKTIEDMFNDYVRLSPSKTLTWLDGSKYTGQWLNQMKNGLGTQTWHNGDKYEGQWLNDKQYGYGKATYTDGTIKEGLWKDGEFIGEE